MKSARACAAALTFVVLITACSGDEPGSPETTAASPVPGMRLAEVPAAAPPGSGPRDLPPTYVALELGAFPRPAAEACADNDNVVEVANGGSISEAVAAAEPGTTVRVAPGTYVENPEGSDAVRWETDNVCVRAAGDGVVVEAAPGQGYGFVFTGDDAVVQGFTLRGFKTGLIMGGREGETQRNVTVESVRIAEPVGDLREGILALGDGAATRTIAHDGVLLLDVTAEGMDQGISCNSGPCTHWWVERTRVVGRQAVEGSGADTFAIEDGSQIVLVDVSMSGAGADGIDTKATDVVVYGARVADIGRNAIKLWHGGDVIEAEVDGSGADASLVGDAAGRYRYLNCLVTHHDPGGTGYVAGWSYDTRAPVTVEIVNSIFYENASGGSFVPESADLSMRNTIYYAPAGDKLFDVGSTTYTVGELSEFEAAGYGSGNIVADPGFVDAAAGDFATVPASPARGAGVFVSGLTRDIDGRPRPADGPPDIGPVQSGE